MLTIHTGASSKTLAAGDDSRPSIEELTSTPDVELHGLTLRVKVREEASRLGVSGLIASLRPTFDDQDLQRWVCRRQTTRDYATCGATYKSRR